MSNLEANIGIAGDHCDHEPGGGAFLLGQHVCWQGLPLLAIRIVCGFCSTERPYAAIAAAAVLKGLAVHLPSFVGVS
jgi:hypothetical protein